MSSPGCCVSPGPPPCTAPTNQIICYDCGADPTACNFTPIGTQPCTKDLNSGNFCCPVSPLTTGDNILCVDNCNPDDKRVGQPVAVLPPPVAPLLSPQMIIVLVASLALVGLVGLARMRLNR
jgi:hypothetical protein